MKPDPGGNEVRVAPARFPTGLVKVALGVMLIIALVVWGQLDFKALSALAGSPGSVLLCMGLVFLSIPLGAWRWGYVLRALNLSLPFSKLFHFFALGAATNLVLLGSAGGDAVRGVMAWRALEGGSGRVAISIVADRIFGILGLLTIAVLAAASNWRWMWSIPALAALASLLLLASLAVLGGIALLFLAPDLVRGLARHLTRWPRLAHVVLHIQDVIDIVRSNPLALLIAFALSLLIQVLMLLGVLVIADAVGIGRLTSVDYLFAAPLTFVVNALPLTPNGLGVGEAAFDQICRWLEAAPSGAAYSSIFFAYRAVAMLGSLCGLVSFAFQRRQDRALQATSPRGGS